MTKKSKLDRNDLIQSVRVLLGDHIEEELKLDGSLVLRGGDPNEVIAVSEFTVQWDGPQSIHTERNARSR